MILPYLYTCLDKFVAKGMTFDGLVRYESQNNGLPETTKTVHI